MKRTFYALRFTEDENLRDRVYWYLSEREYREGERVLAPVGPHDRLQCARIERIFCAAAGEEPYDPRLAKYIAAKLGARRVCAGDTVLTETGGVRYDGRHYTQLFRVLVTKEGENTERLRPFGIETFVRAGADALEELSRSRGCTLLYGARAEEIAAELLRIVKGETDGGLGEDARASLIRKMTLGGQLS